MINALEDFTDGTELYWLGITVEQRDYLINNILMPIYRASQDLEQMQFIKDMVRSLRYGLKDWIPPVQTKD